MKVFNRCPCCSKIILGYKKTRKAGSKWIRAQYENHCPHCNCALDVQVEHKISLVSMIAALTVGAYFVFGYIKHSFLQFVVSGQFQEHGLIHWSLYVFLLVLVIAIYATGVLLVGNKCVNITLMDNGQPAHGRSCA